MRRRTRESRIQRVVVTEYHAQRRWDWLIEGTVIVASSIVASLVLVLIFHI